MSQSLYTEVVFFRDIPSREKKLIPGIKKSRDISKMKPDDRTRIPRKNHEIKKKSCSPGYRDFRNFIPEITPGF